MDLINAVYCCLLTETRQWHQSVWDDRMQGVVTNGKAKYSAFAAKASVIVNKTRLGYFILVCQSSQQIALSSRYFKPLHPFTVERLNL